MSVATATKATATAITDTTPTRVATVAAKATTSPRANLTPVATVDELRAAFDAADSTTSYSDAAAATLQARLLSRYAYHAEREAREVDGVRVLSDSDRKEVAARVWLDATGRTIAPAAADRTPAAKSVGQYVSRFGTVATDLAYGLAWLTGTDSANDAYKEISAAKAAAKAKEAEAAAAVAAANEYNEFTAYLALANQDTRESFELVTAFLTGPTGRRFAEAFTNHITVTNA